MKRSWSARPLLRWSAILIPAVILGVLAWRHRWVADDGFIDLHIDDNLLAGFGPVFNIGERVEAYTSPLWVALVALVGLAAKPFAATDLPPLEWISVALGILCSVAALVLASLASDRLLRAGPRAQADAPHESLAPASAEASAPAPVAADAALSSLPMPFGSLAVLAMVPFWDYATSGLETSLVFLWLALSFWALVRASNPVSRRTELLTALLIGLGPLVRPDLGIFSLLFGGLLLGFAAGSRRRFEILIAMLALPLGYQLFRMGYFACLVPNTAVAKEASLAYWKHGWIYFKEFEETYQFWVLTVTLVGAQALAGARLWGDGERRAVLLVAAPAAGGVLYGLYITRVGGDFLHARLLLPGVFGLILPVATVPLRELRVVGVLMVAWACFCIRFAVIPTDSDDLGIERGRLNFILLSKNEHPVTVQDYKQMGWGVEADKLAKKLNQAAPVSSADPNTFYSSSGKTEARPAELNGWVRAQAVAYRGAIGLFSYKGRQRIHTCDYFGLADPFGARLELGWTETNSVWRVNRGKPGHEKRIKAEWCLARTVASLNGKQPNTSERYVLEALRCGDLAELEAAVTEPLTWDRFWRNVTLSPRLTRLRIPPDAKAARDRFCG